MITFTYLCHKESAGVNHIQEVSEPTKERVLGEKEEGHYCKRFNFVRIKSLKKLNPPAILISGWFP